MYMQRYRYATNIKSEMPNGLLESLGLDSIAPITEFGLRTTLRITRGNGRRHYHHNTKTSLTKMDGI